MKSVKALSGNGQKMKKHSSFARFMVLVAVLVGYLLFAVHQFGLSNGILVAALSWSFFVFCTPIADAGFMLDFPIRLITGLRMLVIEDWSVGFCGSFECLRADFLILRFTKKQYY
jgi:hypothetical protein